jgi:hypothetical protein
LRDGVVYWGVLDTLSKRKVPVEADVEGEICTYMVVNAPAAGCCSWGAAFLRVRGE